MQGNLTAWWTWSVIYVVCIAAISYSTWRGRESAIAGYENARGRSEWAEWKTAAQELAAEGNSFGRRPPKSDELPALVLLRDYFATCLTAILLSFTAIYAILAVLVTGALRTRVNPLDDPSDDRPSDPGDDPGN